MLASSIQANGTVPTVAGVTTVGLGRGLLLGGWLL
jgi:hypothetical protein